MRRETKNLRATIPLIRLNQTIKVYNRKGKGFNVRVLKPNSKYKNFVEGETNGKTYLCWFFGGGWHTR